MPVLAGTTPKAQAGDLPSCDIFWVERHASMSQRERHGRLTEALTSDVSDYIDGLNSSFGGHREETTVDIIIKEGIKEGGIKCNSGFFRGSFRPLFRRLRRFAAPVQRVFAVPLSVIFVDALSGLSQPLPASSPRFHIDQGEKFV